jgi:hypothetical protein
MIRELDIISREFSKPNTVNVVRHDLNLFQSDLKKEAKSFLEETERRAIKDKRNKIILISLSYE